MGQVKMFAWDIKGKKQFKINSIWWLSPNSQWQRAPPVAHNSPHCLKRGSLKRRYLMIVLINVYYIHIIKSYIQYIWFNNMYNKWLQIKIKCKQNKILLVCIFKKKEQKHSLKNRQPGCIKFEQCYLVIKMWEMTKQIYHKINWGQVWNHRDHEFLVNNLLGFFFHFFPKFQLLIISDLSQSKHKIRKKEKKMAVQFNPPTQAFL